MYTLEYLLAHSNLPGPRGNLELLHMFAKNADEDVVHQCLSVLTADTSNCPEEFAGMCGIVGRAMNYRGNLADVFDFLRGYASHSSWRIREAVAIAVQEVALGRIGEVLAGLRPWCIGNAFEKRAVVAALCEPKLLINKDVNCDVLQLLSVLTDSFIALDKLNEGEKVLRQALGYGWSVAIAAQASEGKAYFEAYSAASNKHIQWILRENLKKNRLAKMDKEWVERMKL